VAVVELAVFFQGWGLEGVVVKKVAVVDGDDFARAGGGEVDYGGAVGDDGVVGVDECGGDVGYVVPVGVGAGGVSGRGGLVR
jgi:hypothetical protein